MVVWVVSRYRLLNGQPILNFKKKTLQNFHSLHMYIDPHVSQKVSKCSLFFYARLSVTKNWCLFATSSEWHSFITFYTTIPLTRKLEKNHK